MRRCRLLGRHRNSYCQEWRQGGPDGYPDVSKSCRNFSNRTAENTEKGEVTWNEQVLCNSVFSEYLAYFVSIIFLATSNEAMARQRNVSRTGPNGNTSSRSTAVTPAGNGYNKSTTVTGPQGNTATRQAEGQWDPETKTWTKSATTTGSGGQTATRGTTVTPTGNGYNKSTTVTGPQGSTATRQAEGQWDPETKTWTKSVTTTGEAQ